MSGRKVTLNVDLGELPDEPDALYGLATVVNVACGGHAGDAGSMARAVALARAAGAEVAAHPSYPDRAGFGRRTMTISAPELADSVMAQCAALAAVAGPVRVVKLHGALYHDAARTPEIAAAVRDGVARVLGPVTWVGPATSLLRAPGADYRVEGFADRAYLPDGSLAPRSQPGALIEDPDAAAAQAVRLAATVDTVCVHGDTPGAVEIARAVRAALERAALL